MALDGLVRGLPLLKPQGSGGGGILLPKILSVRQTKMIWNTSLAGNMTNTPQSDSIIFVIAGTGGTWGYNQRSWANNFGIFETVPFAVYTNGANIGALLMCFIPPGVTATITAAFDFDNVGSTYENCIIVECEVENVQRIVERSWAWSVSGSSHSYSYAAPRGDQGFLDIIGGMWDDGGSGVSSHVNQVANPHDDWIAGYTYALAHIGLAWDEPGTHQRGATTTGHNDNASHVAALLY